MKNKFKNLIGNHRLLENRKHFVHNKQNQLHILLHQANHHLHIDPIQLQRLELVLVQQNLHIPNPDFLDTLIDMMKTNDFDENMLNPNYMETCHNHHQHIVHKDLLNRQC